jgi:hypothetical protein
MNADDIEALRKRYFEIAEQLIESVRKSYAPEMERCAGRPERLADLDRAFRRDCEAATRGIVREIAGLPPPRLILQNQPKTVD